MRDPQRIRRILKLVEKIWLEMPDLRLGQLLSNASSNLEADPYFYEDAALEADLERLADAI